MLSVVVFGDGAFESRLGLEAGILMNVISVLINEASERSLTPAAMSEQRER